MNNLFNTILLSVICSLLVLIGVLVVVAFLTLVERKLIAASQNRKGPNIVGPLGILQPFADALKLILKETVIPSNARKILFICSPIVSLFFALLSWAFIPFSYTAVLVDVNIAVFFIFMSSILHVYGIILAGWSSGSKYSFLGALRSTAQLISYDISISVLICCVAIFPRSFNLIDIVEFQDRSAYFVFYLPGVFILFLIAALAETNRHPFDLPEAESELVGGFNTEHNSSFFAFFFLSEYASVLLMVFLINHLFLGGWVAFNFTTLSLLLYMLKILFIYYFFLIIRSAVPRYRYDQLMRLGWKIILPLSLTMFFYITTVIILVNYFIN